MREHVVADDQVGLRCPRRAASRAVARRRRRPRSGCPCSTADRGDVRGRLDAEHRHAVRDEVLQQVAVVAGDLDHLELARRARSRSIIVVGVAPRQCVEPACRRTTRSRRSRVKMCSGGSRTRRAAPASSRRRRRRAADRTAPSCASVLGAHVRVRQRRHAEVDERCGERGCRRSGTGASHAGAVASSDSKRAICSSVSAAASSPAACRRYQSTVQSQRLARGASRGVQPSRARAFEAVEPAAGAASCGCVAGIVLPARRRRPSSSTSRSTTQRTGRASSVVGPEVPAPRRSRAARRPAARRAAGSRASGSSTCCQGRIGVGLRIAHRLAARRARARSPGRAGRSAQSPPPITLPARAVATPRRAGRAKNERAVGRRRRAPRSPCCCCTGRGRRAARPRGSGHAHSRFS